MATDGNVYSNADLGNAISTLFNKKTFKFGIPISIVKVVAFVAEKIGDIRKEPPMLNRNKLGELMAESWICDMQETFTDLQFTPQYDLFLGMKETIDWYKQAGWIK